MIKSFSNTQINSFDPSYKVKFINSLSGFKGVHLIGTKSATDMENLSIISSVFHIGSNPPVLGLIFRPNTVPRHTYENILETKVFTINHIHSEIIEKAHQTSARYPRDISEFKATGLTPVYKPQLNAPFVKESYIKIGLKLVEAYNILCNPTHLVCGEVIVVECDDEWVDQEGRINHNKANSICVNGLDSYYETTNEKRFPYAKP